VKTRFVTAGLVTALLGAGGMTIQTIQHAAAAGTAPAAAFEYSIKYVCGDFAKGPDPNPPEDPEGPVKPGDYQTMIDIHNPNSVTAQFQKKAASLTMNEVAAIEPGSEHAVPVPVGLLSDAAAARIARSVPAETQRAYRDDLTRFVDWCGEESDAGNTTVEALPATADTLASYLTWMADTGRAPSTIERALAAIIRAHKVAGLPRPDTQAPPGCDPHRAARRRRGRTRGRQGHSGDRRRAARPGRRL
jgi:hypothetical protein